MEDELTDPDKDTQAPAEEDESIGFFPSWASLYWSVAIYTLASILLLYWMTVALDFRVT